MKYLKYFQEDSEYTEYKNSSDYILPNVSYIVAATNIYYEAPVVIPHNEIWYTTSDGNVVTPYDTNVFGANIVSNTYVDGKGVIEFDGNVTTIGDYAFSDCYNLISITIPDSVTTIGEGAFCNCHSLTSINIPDSVTSIGNSAFITCTNLTSVTIPDSVTTIGDSAFNWCENLTSVTIPDSVTSIGERAFYGCTSLTSVTIPDRVTTIGSYAFADCTGELIINSKIIETDYPYNKRPTKNGWLSDAKFTKLTIGDGIEKIGNYAFYECSSIISVTIPDSVTTIGADAFINCTNLTSVYCKATTPPSWGEYGVFENNASGRKIYVPTNSVSAYKSATNWSGYASYIVGYDF